MDWKTLDSNTAPMQSTYIQYNHYQNLTDFLQK